MSIDALSVSCAQLTLDLLAIAKFLLCLHASLREAQPLFLLSGPKTVFFALQG